jgi:5-methylcytosine-specific restriction protein A
MTPEVHRWYQRAAWKKRARHQLERFPLCQQCLRENKITAAEVVDHLERVSGNINTFWTSPIQSLCRAHHDSWKQGIEARGYDDTIGSDGFPVDRAHPFWRRQGTV